MICTEIDKLICTEIDGSGSGRWNAIFRTDDHDYCREELPSDVQDSDAARLYALDLFLRTADIAARKVVTNYRLERW
tara:strand:+ start:70 stop:300 length:231 start_codon:yes stop_codon:yes gene_type:complete